MRKTALLLFSFAITIPLIAQNILQDPVTGKVFNSDRYSGIKGSPFLFDKWMDGNVTIPQGVYKDLELRFDAYGNTLYFKKGDDSYEFRDGVIGFTLMPKPEDSTSYLIYKKGISGSGIKPDQFVQVLAEGKLSLYRSDIKLVSDVNQINQGVVKTFTTSIRYFLQKDDALQLIKLNNKDVYDVMKDKEQQIESFVGQNKLSPRKESDVAKIIRYYNTL